MPSKSKAVAVRTVDLTAQGTIPADAIRSAVRDGTKLRVNLDNADIALAMLERKLSATSVEQLTSSGELDDLAAIDGKAVKVVGVGFRNSDDAYAEGEGSLGVYVVLQVATLEGELLAVGTGALDVVVTACKLVELDKLGSWWIIGKSDKATAAGYRPINMTPASVTDDGLPF